MEEATQIHQANLNFYLKENLKKDALLSYLNISSVAVHSSNFKVALKAMESFFKYYSKYKMNEPIFLGMAYVNRQEAKNGSLPVSKKAITDYYKAIDIFKSVNNSRFIRLVYINLAEHYQSIGSNSKMIEYALKATEITEQTELNERQEEIYNLLYKYYKQKKDLESAFKYLELLNQEREVKKKEEATNLILKNEIRQQLKKQKINSDNSNSTYFHNSDCIQLSQAKVMYDIKVLDITSVEVDKNGFASVNTIQGKTYRTTMPFSMVMDKVSASNHKQHFFYTNKRKQAINLVFKKEVNKQKHTITLEFPDTTKTFSFTVRQYYELLKLEKSQRS